jgi:long-subunit acyl-CoA synthetase (AMP-forming)
MEVVNALMRSLPHATRTLWVLQGGRREELPLRRLWEPVRRLAMRLATQGVQHGDSVGVLAKNSLEWIVLDLACIYLGARIAPVDASAGDPRELVETFDLKLLFTDLEAYRGVVSGRIRDLSDVRRLAGLQGEAPGEPVAAPAPVTYASHDTLALKFTSGSTGRPKALAATVGSIDDSLTEVDRMFAHGARDRILVFLPLALLQQRYWIYSAIVFGHDVVVTTFEYVFFGMRMLPCTVMMGVPGFYNAFRQLVLERFAQEPELARAADEHAARRRDRGGAHETFGPVHDMMGGNIRYLWTGSAPSSADTLDFFATFGIPVYEGYGLNETCIVSKNHPGAYKRGSVGKVLANKKVELDALGQIIVRSAHPVNTRYERCEPGESERVFADDGSVRTGDMGYLDDDGFLHLTGRVSDLIVLSTGKNVFPQKVEFAVEASTSIRQCVVYGHGKPHLVAVVVPRSPKDDQASIERDLATINATLQTHEKIKRVVVVEQGFTQDNGLLTNQHKVKRPAICERYREQLERCYEA